MSKFEVVKTKKKKNGDLVDALGFGGLRSGMEERQKKMDNAWRGFKCSYCDEFFDGQGDYELHLIYEELKLIREALTKK